MELTLFSTRVHFFIRRLKSIGCLFSVGEEGLTYTRTSEARNERISETGCWSKSRFHLQLNGYSENNSVCKYRVSM